MSPRPKNPPPDRRQEILEAALRVFARDGYAAATNGQIAREAGVTSAALYYYFASKEEMFKAAIGERKGSFVPELTQLIQSDLLEKPPAEALPILWGKVLEFVTQERTTQILRLMLSEGPRNPELVEIWQTTVMGEVMPVLFGYVTRQMEKGLMPPMDPRILFLTLNGPILSAVLFRDLLKLPMLSDLTNAELARQIPRFMLSGLLPQGGNETEA